MSGLKTGRPRLAATPTPSARFESGDNGQHADTRLVRLARRLGNATGLVRRLVPNRWRKAEGHRSATRATPRSRPVEKAIETRPVAARRSESAELTRLERRKRELESDLAQLDRELERIHGMIGSGVSGRGNEPEYGDTLQDWIAKARTVREQVHECRLQQLRIDRQISRERQLIEHRARTAADEDRTQGLLDPPAPEPNLSDPTLAGRRRSALAIVEGHNFDSRTERLRFAGLAEQLAATEADARREAARELSGMDGTVAHDLLLLCVDDRSERVRLVALNALARWHDSQKPGVLRRFLDDGSAHVRMAAMRGLDDDLADTEVVAALEDAEADVRRAATAMMGRRRSSESTSALIYALGDEDALVRITAADALGHRGDDRAVLSLIRTLGDDDTGVRDAADRALRSIVGERIEDVGAGLSAERRIGALKAWWKAARVDRVLDESGLGGTAPAHDAMPTDGAEAGRAPIESVRDGASAAAPAPRSAKSRTREADAIGTKAAIEAKAAAAAQVVAKEAAAAAASVEAKAAAAAQVVAREAAAAAAVKEAKSVREAKAVEQTGAATTSVAVEPGAAGAAIADDRDGATSEAPVVPIEARAAAAAALPGRDEGGDVGLGLEEDREGEATESLFGEDEDEDGDEEYESIL